MSDENDAASRTEEPSPRKLQQARERGEVVKTPDLAALASLSGAAAVMAAQQALLAWWVLKPHMAQLENLAAMDPAAMLSFATDILRRLVFAVAAFLLVVAGADWFWQRQRFMARMRMTKEELKEDFKQSEGDPHGKA